MSKQPQLELLYKKYLGTPDAYPSQSYGNESAGSSRPNIIAQSQLYAQSIPSVAPSDFILFGYVSLVNGKTTITTTSSDNIGTIYTSVSYPWIQKVQLLQLQSVTPSLSYYFNSATLGNAINSISNVIIPSNLLTNAIR